MQKRSWLARGGVAAVGTLLLSSCGNSAESNPPARSAGGENSGSCTFVAKLDDVSYVPGDAEIAGPSLKGRRIQGVIGVACDTGLIEDNEVLSAWKVRGYSVQDAILVDHFGVLEFMVSDLSGD